MTTKGGPFLSQLQCRILISIFTSKKEYLNSETILKETGIAQSTWSEEQNRLSQMGLLEKRQSRIMTSNLITRVMNYRLTDKGRLVALNLSNISRILAPDQFSASGEVIASGISDSTQGSEARDEMELDERILECIEIGLESFGMNLDELVRSEIEKSGEISWNQISRHPDRLEAQLNKLFGTGGSTAIESMIAANIRSRFGMRSINSDKLSVLIDEIHLKAGKIFSKPIDQRTMTP